jgi:4-hydroxy-3-polyprenylbenzoate decarboxylase
MEAGFRRDLPPLANLREFIDYLRSRGEVRDVDEPVSAALEVTEVHRRVIASDGPVLQFNRPVKADGRVSDLPLLVNRFGTRERVAAVLGTHSSRLIALGESLVSLQHPTPPLGLP